MEGQSTPPSIVQPGFVTPGTFRVMCQVLSRLDCATKPARVSISAFRQILTVGRSPHKKSDLFLEACTPCTKQDIITFHKDLAVDMSLAKLKQVSPATEIGSGRRRVKGLRRNIDLRSYEIHGFYGSYPVMPCVFASSHPKAPCTNSG